MNTASVQKSVVMTHHQMTLDLLEGVNNYSDKNQQ